MLILHATASAEVIFQFTAPPPPIHLTVTPHGHLALLLGALPALLQVALVVALGRPEDARGQHLRGKYTLTPTSPLT